MAVFHSISAWSSKRSVMLETSNDMIINTPDAMRVDAVSISDLKKKRERETLLEWQVYIIINMK